MSDEIGGLAEREFTRRSFLRGAGSVAVSSAIAPYTRSFLRGAGSLAVLLVPFTISIGVPASVGSGCATIETAPVQDSDFIQGSRVGILFDYDASDGQGPEHGYHVTENPKGIDFTSGRIGTILTAPTIGHVWDSGPTERMGKHVGSLVKIETPFGHMIELSCGKDIGVKINDSVTPWSFIEREYTDCGKGSIGVGRADKPHVHEHILDQPFAPRYKKGAHLPFTMDNGITHHLVNPNSYRAYGSHVREAMFTGDYPHVERLVAQQRRMLDDIEGRHPDSYLAWFLREAGKDPMIRDFLKVLVASKMRENGMLEPRVSEDVDAVLYWESNLTGFLFAPYANPQLAAEYRRRQPHLFEGASRVDPKGEKEKAHAHWGIVDNIWQTKDYRRAIEALEEHRRLYGVYGEEQVYANLGTGHGQLGKGDSSHFSKAARDLLIADAMLSSYKFGPTDPKFLNFNRYWTTGNLAFVHGRLGMSDKERFYRSKQRGTNLK